MKFTFVAAFSAALLFATTLELPRAQNSRRSQSSSASISPDDWATYNRTLAGDRFSPLDQITTANVRRLRQLCTFDTGEQVSFQTGPVVVNGAMYFTTDTSKSPPSSPASRCQGVYRSERTYGSFYRAIPLPEGAMSDQAKASFNNGVLEITMPAPPEQVNKARRLDINEGAGKSK